MASTVNTLANPEMADGISREELLQRLGDPSLIVVDVLPKEAYSSGHIQGAINLPLAELAMHAPQVLPNRATEIAVYCASFT